MTTTMTPVASLLSTKTTKRTHERGTPTGKTDFDSLVTYAAEEIGRAIRDLTDAGIPSNHPTLTALLAVADAVCDLSESDTTWTPTNTATYTLRTEEKAAPVAYVPDAQNVPANDITAARERFVSHLQSEKRVKGSVAREFIGADHATVIGSLVFDQTIVETRQGRGVFYALAVKADAAPVAAPVAKSNDDAIPFGNDASPVEVIDATPVAAPVVAESNETEATAAMAPKTRKTRKSAPRKVKSAPAVESKTESAGEMIAREALTLAKAQMTTEDGFAVLGKAVSKLDTVKAKRAAKLMAELRSLLTAS